MTGTDLCVNKPPQSRSYLNHLVYLLIKYIKSVLWRVAKCLSYIEEARCLKVNPIRIMEICSYPVTSCIIYVLTTACMFFFFSIIKV